MMAEPRQSSEVTRDASRPSRNSEEPRAGVTMVGSKPEDQRPAILSELKDQKVMAAEAREQQRKEAQARLRNKKQEIARLTTRLVRAVEVPEDSTVDAILQELEEKAGSNSSYYLNLRAYVALVREQYDEVEEVLGIVLASDPSNLDAGLNMAIAESRTGRVGPARERLQQLALEHPADHRIRDYLQILQHR